MRSRQPSGGRGGHRHPGGPIVRRNTVRLSPEITRRVRLGHPWVYKETLGNRMQQKQPGDVIELVDGDGDFVARGFLDGESAIGIRVMTRNPDQEIGPGLIAARVRSAVSLRTRLMDLDRFQATRIVNSESDGLPGIVVDRYADYLVVQLFTAAVGRFREALYDSLESTLEPRAIYEQRRYRSLGGDAPRQGAELVRGEPAPVDLEVQEGDLRFIVDVTAPLSTGLFSDLRLGRATVARWAKDRRMVNLFSYTGSISVYAAHGGATEVTAVDVSSKAHARARRNFAINGFDAEKPEHISGDAFKVLAKFAERGRMFDMVVIDPPAFASATRQGKTWSAVKDYGELVCASLNVLERGGVFIAASTTHKLSLEEFEGALANGARRAKTSLRIVERTSLPVDFPTAPGFPEASYLKFVVAVRD